MLTETVYFAHEIDPELPDSVVFDPVIAVFADSLGRDWAGMYTAYVHAGQHVSCSPEWIQEKTRPATQDEAAPLLAELQRLPGESVTYTVIEALP